MALRIEDYALIGDCETAALVGRDGSIDWLCFPRFDSAACFAALLGTRDHGRWQIVPQGPILATRRRYRDGTLILETEYETADGVVAVIDCMPPRTVAPDVVRIVEGRRGCVPMQMELVIRFDYGSTVPWVRKTDNGLYAIAGPNALYLETPVELQGENMHTAAQFDVHAGEHVPLSLSWYPSHLPQPDSKDARESIVETAEWWQEWSDRCTYEGEWREAVLRSLITLKAMAYRPTGGLVAAVTSSLPEQLGGVRNWDYRYCWVRDATFTLYALMVGGYTDEALAWREWLVRAVAGRPEEIQIMYGVAGERWLDEREISWLPGYESSTPVRVGNAASSQFQLDIFGEVMDALYFARCRGLPEDDNVWRVQRTLMKGLETLWKEPDDGLWEMRGQRRHFTHSKVMAWVAFDRAIKSIEEFGLDGPADRWRKIRQEIHEQVCRDGFDDELNSFVQFYGARQLDASLLMLPVVGFLPATDPRMQGTIAAVEKNLKRNGFVDRYPTSEEVDGLPPGEGSFLICTFWLADNLALSGRRAEAREMFERLLSLRNDVGLLSEEYDPIRQRLLGNFPQALSHIGLINTARNLSQHGGPAEDRPHPSGTD